MRAIALSRRAERTVHREIIEAVCSGTYLSRLPLLFVSYLAKISSADAASIILLRSGQEIMHIQSATSSH